MTAALLDRNVAAALARRGITEATPQQKQNLAAVFHLCGGSIADLYARRGFRLAAGQRCGDHDVARYLAQFNATKAQFAQMAAAEED